MIAYTDINALFLSLIMLAGLLFLYLGGEGLCRGGGSLALRFHIHPMIVGLTIISIATSLPELITSFLSASRGSPGLAIGNILGSNIANIGLVLGLSAMVYPIQVNARIIKIEMPILMAASVAFMLFAFGGKIATWQGVVAFIGFLIYVAYISKQALKEKKEVQENMTKELKANQTKSLALIIIYLTVGTLMLVFGAELLVSSAVELAMRMGVSEVFIGLTIVAVGTSFPELAASLVAAIHKESDLCAGNIVGSNLFNILLIGGGVSAVYSMPIDTAMLWVEFPVMIVMTAVIWRFFVTNRRVSRIEGLLLLIIYFLAIGLFSKFQLV